MALQDPPPNIQAHPAPNNLLEWHYALEGAKGTEYEGGVYHGKITFPADYPYKPPSIVMLTASGRFAINTKLCLSMTNFHPGELEQHSYDGEKLLLCMTDATSPAHFGGCC